MKPSSYEVGGPPRKVYEWLDMAFGPELDKTAKVLCSTGFVLLVAGQRLMKWRQTK